MLGFVIIFIIFLSLIYGLHWFITESYEQIRDYLDRKKRK